jgi:hypothetical protein
MTTSPLMIGGIVLILALIGGIIWLAVLYNDQKKKCDDEKAAATRKANQPESSSEKSQRQMLERIFEQHVHEMKSAAEDVRNTADLLYEQDSTLNAVQEAYLALEEFKTVFKQSSKVDNPNETSIEHFKPLLGKAFAKACLTGENFMNKKYAIYSNEKFAKTLKSIEISKGAKGSKFIENFKLKENFNALVDEVPVTQETRDAAFDAHGTAKTKYESLKNQVRIYVRNLKKEWPKYVAFAENFEEKMDSSREILGDCSTSGCDPCCAFSCCGSCHLFDCGVCDCCGCSDSWCCPPTNPPSCGYDGALQCSAINGVIAGLAALCSSGATKAGILAGLTSLCGIADAALVECPPCILVLTSLCAYLATQLGNYSDQTICPYITGGGLLNDINSYLQCQCNHG